MTLDLILMDAVMPVMDGFQTCRNIKADEALAHLPVIFMTGLSDTEHVVLGLEGGGVDYVSKPIVLDELLARIKVHLVNAQIANRTRTALDATGRFLLATNEAGRLLWCTPQAEKRLRLAVPRFSTGEFVLPGNNNVSVDGKQLTFSFLSRTGKDEYLYRLSETGGGQ